MAPWILGTWPTWETLIHRPPRHQGIEVSMRSREQGALLLAGPGDQGGPGGMGTWSPGTAEARAPAPSRSTRNIGSNVHEVARPAGGPWFQYLRGNQSTRVSGKPGIKLPMGLDTAVAMATWFVGTMVRPRRLEDADEPAMASGRVRRPRPISGRAGGSASGRRHPGPTRVSRVSRDVGQPDGAGTAPGARHGVEKKGQGGLTRLILSVHDNKELCSHAVVALWFSGRGA